MRLLVYGLVIRAYALGIRFGSVFNTKAKLWVKGRNSWRGELSGIKKNEFIWFHCASLGEYEDVKYVIQGIQRNFPEAPILLTFFSPSGFEVLKKENVVDKLMYLPLDTRRNARDFIQLLQPKAAFFSRSELWYNYLMFLRQNKVPVFLTSLSLGNESKFLKWPVKRHYTDCLKAFTHIYAQEETTKQLLIDNGLSDVSITGNTRFDAAFNASKKELYSDVEGFVQEEFCVVVGSCLPRDEKIIEEVMVSLKGVPIKWIIAPHEFHESGLEKSLKNHGLTTERYSDQIFSDSKDAILLIDFVGGLKHLYRFANVAVIGGGFDAIGIHSILEPAVYGIPVAFGANHRNKKEALDLLDINCAEIFKSADELLAFVKMHKESTSRTQEVSNEISAFFKKNLGASERIVQHASALIH